MSVSVCLCLFCLWMSGGVSIDLGDIFGMPALLGSVFGDSLHEGFAQTGAPYGKIPFEYALCV